MEEWKDIEGYEGVYQVSNKGRVKRCRTTITMRNQNTSWEHTVGELIMSPSLDSKGYPQVTLTIGGRRVARVHRLVAEAFLPPPSQEILHQCTAGGVDYVLVNHIDNDRTRNEVENLEWASPASNTKHCVDQRRINISTTCGSKNYCAILTEDKVDEILLLLKSGLSQQTVADIFGVKQITISNIKTGRSWAWYTKIKRKPRSSKATCH